MVRIAPLSTILIAVLLAGSALYGLERRVYTSVLNTNQGRDGDVFTREDYDRKGIASVRNIAAEVERLTALARTASYPAPARVVWLGNSQLHSIIDEQPGDFLVSHWLKSDWPRQCCRSLELRVFSPASPSLQEQFVLSQYIVNRVPLDAMIVAIPFNDFMQDGLRDDFVFILSAELRSHLEELSVGKKVVSRAAKPLKSDPPASTISFQARADAWLSERLAAFSELWRMRPDFRTILATDVLSVRNWIFDVQPTRVRKLIKARYDLNMEALTAIVSDLHNKQIAAILYIPPLAQDHPFPYDHDEYKAFKADIMNVAHTYSATMLDLEQAVPADLWDRHAIDYMHFNGEGHKLLAKALLPVIRNLVCAR